MLAGVDSSQGPAVLDDKTPTLIAIKARRMTCQSRCVSAFSAVLLCLGRLPALLAGEAEVAAVDLGHVRSVYASAEATLLSFLIGCGSGHGTISRTPAPADTDPPTRRIGLRPLVELALSRARRLPTPRLPALAIDRPQPGPHAPVDAARAARGKTIFLSPGPMMFSSAGMDGRRLLYLHAVQMIPIDHWLQVAQNIW